MKRFLHIVSLVIIVLSALSSCRAISSFLHDDDVVAKAGKGTLYRTELESVIPKGLSKEDSTRFALQYINTWATDMVFLSIAEEQLPKDEQDVTSELEDYRRSLLKYRYEQLFVNQRLDTTVTDDRIEEYYQAHKDKFKLSRPVVKARYLRIASDSPLLEKIRKKMSSEDPEDVAEADSLSYSGAMEFTTWNDSWQDVSVLSRAFSMDWDALSALRRGNWISSTDENGILNLAYISAMTPQGQIAPLGYCSEKIKDIIVSARKQALISSLERDLLNDARGNGTFVIY